MSSTPAPDPQSRRRISSTPILKATLVWGIGVGLVIAGLAAAVGAAVSGGDGALSGLIGALVGIVFPAMTAVSILVANRWYGQPMYLQFFFAVVLGSWVVKFLVVVIALALLRGAPWMDTVVFFFALLATAIASLVVDLVVLSRMRMPAVSDVTLPGDPPSTP
jgi:hypothetical protein